MMNNDSASNAYAGEVLIIDDNPSLLQTLYLILTEGGYRVHSAVNGPQGLRAVMDNAPDIILLDIIMPEMDGFEVIQQLKRMENSRDIPVIFVTSSDDAVDKAQGFKLGAVDYIIKPFDSLEVLARVKTHLSLYQMRKALEESNSELLKARDELEQLNSGLEERVKLRSAELEESHRALRKRESELSAIYDNAPLIMLLVDRDRRVVLLNKQAQAMADRSREEALGFRGGEVLRCVHRSDDPRGCGFGPNCGDCGVRRTVAETYQQGKAFHRREVMFPYRPPGGKPYNNMFFLVSTTPLSISGKDLVLVCLEDITERKQAEEALRENEELLRKIAENYPNTYISIIEKDFTVGFSSGQEFAKKNLDPRQFKGLSLEQVFGEFAGTVRPYYEKTFTGEECSFELYLNNEYQLYRTVPLVSEDGRIHRILAVVENISVRKLEENVQAAQLRLIDYAANHSVQELLCAFLDETESLTGSQIGFYHFVSDDQVTIELQTWSTNTLKHMCKTMVEDTHYPISRAGVWVDCVREHRSMIYNDYPGLPHKQGLPDGHAPVVRMIVVPVFRGDKIKAILGVGNKKTDYNQADVNMVKRLADMAWETVYRKRAELELYHLRNYLSNIIDYMPSILIGVDSQCRVTQWNKEVEQVTGIPSHQAQGEILSAVFPRMAGEMDKIERSIRTLEIQRELKKPRPLKNTTCYENITIYPLETDGMEGAVIRIDDVTEFVRLEEMMVQSEKMLSVGGLAAGMAHEINNPLSGIMLTANNMAGRLINDIDLPANLKAAESSGVSMESIAAYMKARGIPRMIDTIIQSGRRVASIVDNMLSFARKSDARTSRHSVTRLLDKTLELAATDYDMKKHYDFKLIRITKEYEEFLPDIPCESAKIQQVLLNILRNGAQAMQQAGTREPVFIVRARLNKKRSIAEIEIEDNGPGMDEEIRKRVFEPFFTTKPVGVGTGLGLSVSYFIISENHGGEMAVQSRPGAGARFIIRLPLERENEGK